MITTRARQNRFDGREYYEKFFFFGLQKCISRSKPILIRDTIIRHGRINENYRTKKFYILRIVAIDVSSVFGVHDSDNHCNVVDIRMCLNTIMIVITTCTMSMIKMIKTRIQEICHICHRMTVIKNTNNYSKNRVCRFFEIK